MHLSHVLEHFTKPDRERILCELFRILKPGGNASIITPCGDRHWQDPTHKDGPVVAAFYFYFNRNWREANKLTHNEYERLANVNFEPRIDYTLHPEVASRSDQARLFMATFYNNATMDLYANLAAVK